MTTAREVWDSYADELERRAQEQTEWEANPKCEERGIGDAMQVIVNELLALRSSVQEEPDTHPIRMTEDAYYELLGLGYRADCLLRKSKEKPAARAVACLHACDGLDTVDLAKNARGWIADVVLKAAGVESQLNYALRSCCAGNTEDCEPVRCQSYEASEQSEPCPRGRCVMADETYGYDTAALEKLADAVEDWPHTDYWPPAISERIRAYASTLPQSAQNTELSAAIERERLANMRADQAEEALASARNDTQRSLSDERITEIAVKCANDSSGRAEPAMWIMDAIRLALREAALSETAQPPASEAFTEWLCREMPEGTVIGDPKWWASRIMRAVLRDHGGTTKVPGEMVALIHLLDKLEKEGNGWSPASFPHRSNEAEKRFRAGIAANWVSIRRLIPVAPSPNGETEAGK